MNFVPIYSIQSFGTKTGLFGKNFRVLPYRLCGDLQNFPSSAISNSSSSSSSVVKAVWQKYATKIWENNETVHTFEEQFRRLDYTLEKSLISFGLVTKRRLLRRWQKKKKKKN